MYSDTPPFRTRGGFKNVLFTALSTFFIKSTAHPSALSGGCGIGFNQSCRAVSSSSSSSYSYGTWDKLQRRSRDSSRCSVFFFKKLQNVTEDHNKISRINRKPIVRKWRNLRARCKTHHLDFRARVTWMATCVQLQPK